ncbi:helix-turn-helix domain-containing protein [Prevotella sp. AGR2160]|uniref:helix-turn-helix domain-containing protein n=1 Tax=Prevotella sp. AGR2160 TaxID=1280674 RepID=UPI0006872A2A|nr:helix-turn-helix transcriptional regulator [Prevotella sp. AGR2160]
MNIPKTLANNIKLLRNHYNYTQKQVSNYLGISQPAYSKYEDGKVDVPMDKIEKLATLYNVEEYDLLTDETGSLKADMVFAYRRSESDVDLSGIAKFQKIVKNYIEISHELEV